MNTTALPTMTNETHQLLASQLRLACDALITTPTGEAFNQLSCAVAAIARAGISGVAVELGCCALYDIFARYQEDAAITVTDGNANRIRAAIASITKALPSLEVRVLKQAIDEINVNCASVGA